MLNSNQEVAHSPGDNAKYSFVVGQALDNRVRNSLTVDVGGLPIQGRVVLLENLHIIRRSWLQPLFCSNEVIQVEVLQPSSE